MHNFGKIKELYNDILSEAIVTKDNDKKKLFKKYVKSLKENEILKTQFSIYRNIEKKIESNEYKINEYIKANIALMDKYSKKEIAEANAKLVDGISEQEASTSEVVQKLHENIHTLIMTNKSAKNIDTIVDATSEIVEYIKENKEKEINESANELPLSLTTSIFVDKFNSKYENLDETTMRLVKTILESDEDGRKEIFKDAKNDCITLVNGKLTMENTLEEKETLLKVKEKLLNMEFVSESHIEDISELIDLKETLTTNLSEEE